MAGRIRRITIGSLSSLSCQGDDEVEQFSLMYFLKIQIGLKSMCFLCDCLLACVAYIYTDVERAFTGNENGHGVER